MQGARCATLCHKVCQWPATGRCFSQGTPVSSTNKTEHHDYNWNTVESGVKHDKPNLHILQIVHEYTSNMKVWFIVFNATFNSISVIIVVFSFIGGGNRSTLRKTPTCRKSINCSSLSSYLRVIVVVNVW
jgi:hypothetical protein